MENMSAGEGIIIALLIGSLVLVIGCILSAVANKYVRENKVTLFEDCSPLSDECLEMGMKLIEDVGEFNAYIDEMGLNQTYNCSSSVVSNAENQMVKYLMKYSNIEIGIRHMEELDFCIEYLVLLDEFRLKIKELRKMIMEYLPWYVQIFATDDKMPYVVCGLQRNCDKIKMPEFEFLYVSPAGRSSRECCIPITKGLLITIQQSVAKKLTKTEHTKAQRSAMTNDLREAIKKRDNYTCCICHNSVYEEPNLLLEVDHIVPIAKGGKTEASNLQTLCWRCNRLKSSN